MTSLWNYFFPHKHKWEKDWRSQETMGGVYWYTRQICSKCKKVREYER